MTDNEDLDRKCSAMEERLIELGFSERELDDIAARHIVRPERGSGGATIVGIDPKAWGRDLFAKLYGADKEFLAAEVIELSDFDSPLNTARYDGWSFGNSDDNMFPCPVDEDGDCVTSSCGAELDDADNALRVRVAVPLGTTNKEALRLLDKIRKMIKGKPDMFTGSCEVKRTVSTHERAQRIVDSLLSQHPIVTDRDLAYEIAKRIKIEADDCPF